MTTIKTPLLSGSDFLGAPYDVECMICNRRMIPESSAKGNYRFWVDTSHSAVESEKLILDIWLEFSSADPERWPTECVTLVKELVGGEAQLVFCSRKCMKLFFNKVCDLLPDL